MFAALKARIVEIQGAPARVAQAAAPELLAKVRADLTTRRGNVPAYGKMGDIPIKVDARPEAITISGVDWAVQRAQTRGQIDGWVAVVQNVARRLLGGG